MTILFDLCIRGGTLVDGTGEPGVRGDIGIRGGKLTELGSFVGDAQQTIDASGLTITPGFVDMHTHYDAQVFWDPTLSPSSRHGVTTIVGGNCGFSIAPLNGNKDDADYLMRMLARVEGMPLESLRQGAPWNWTSFEEYLGRIDGTLAINAGFMVGHSAMRRAVMGERAVGHKATTDEVLAMKDLLRTSLKAGGLGFSTTVSPSHNDGDGNPVPSRHASYGELIALAGVLSEFDGMALEFLPNMQSGLKNDQLELMTSMALAARCPLNWNFINPDSQMPQIYHSQLAASDYAAARGAKVVALVSAAPITLRINFISGFVLDLFPGWDELLRLPLADRKLMLTDAAARKKLDDGAQLLKDLLSLYAKWEDWTISEVFSAENKPFQGKTVGHVAELRGRGAFDTIADLVIADDLRTVFTLPARGDDEGSWRMRGDAWKDDRTIVGASDAGAHLDMLDSFASCTQLLGVGVRERRLLSLEEAVRQLTSIPAGLLGLKGRGSLARGNWADLAIFDPATIGCGPLYTRFDLPNSGGRLYADAVGVKHVIVNGEEIVNEQKFNHKFPGKLIRSGRDTHTSQHK